MLCFSLSKEVKGRKACREPSVRIVEYNMYLKLTRGICFVCNSEREVITKHTETNAKMIGFSCLCGTQKVSLLELKENEIQINLSLISCEKEQIQLNINKELKVILLKPEKTKRFWGKPKKKKKVNVSHSVPIWHKEKKRYFERLEKDD